MKKITHTTRVPVTKPGTPVHAKRIQKVPPQNDRRESTGTSRPPTMIDIRTSEERYRRLFETAQDGILILDAESGAITDANPFITNSLGYTLQELLGKRLWEIGAFADVKDSKAAFEQLQEQEYIRYNDLPLRTKRGEVREVEFVSNAYMVDKKKVIQCNIRDITERKSAELKTLEISNQLHATLESITDGFFTIDRDFRFTYVNGQAEQMFRIPREGLLNKSIWTIFPDSAGTILQREYERAVRENTAVQFETRSPDLDRWFDVRAFPSDQGLAVFMRDITTGKKEAELIRLLSTAVEQSHESLVITDAHLEFPGPTIVFVNPAFTKMTGYTAEESIGRSPRMLQGPRTDRAVLHRLRENLERGEMFQGETYNYRKDGTEYIQDWHITPICNASGSITHFVSLQRDITDKKRAKESVDRAYNELTNLYNNLPEAIFSVDTVHNTMLQVSPAHQAVFGCSPDEFLKNPDLWYELIIPEDRHISDASRPQLASGKIVTLQYRIQPPNGAMKWVEVIMKPILDTHGTLIRIDGIASDISERKYAEITLMESNEKFHQLADNITDVFWIRSPDMSEVQYISPAFERVWGRTMETLYRNPKEWPDYIHPDDRSRVQKCFDSLSDAASTLNVEYRILRPNGEIRWVHVRGFQVRNAENALIRHIGIVTDITEQREAEGIRRESERRFREMLENISLLSLQLDMHARVTFCNDYLLHLTGYSREEVIGKNWFTLFVPKELNNERSFIQAMKSDNLPRHFENEILTSAGLRRTISWNNLELRDKDGRMIGSSRIGEDITERKQAETLLRTSEEKYRGIFENVQDVFFESSIDGTIDEISPSISIVSKGQYVRSDLIGHSMFDHYFNPADRSLLVETLRTKGSVSDFEVILKNRDGSQIVCSVSAKIRVDAQGRPSKIIGSLRDITERKESQDALRKGEDRYRRLVEFSPSAIVVHRNGIFLYMNPAAVTLLAAHDKDELLGRSILEILHKDHKESSHSWFSGGAAQQETAPVIREKFLRLDGVTIDVEVTSMLIEYDGQPAMQDVVRDVTEQKKFQEILLQTQKNESIGTLAGGIAHDFNNILGIILGYTNIIEKRGTDPKLLLTSVTAINQAVRRGAALVRQILTFARKTETSFVPVSVFELTVELVSMLSQTFPKIILFQNSVVPSIPFILADRTQMHQVFLNLFVNARDAMPKGGTITITAETLSGTSVRVLFPAADRQEYVCVSVSDTGEGMDEATRKRIFDPFFTTKPQGKGTGLGLSVVYGVLQAHHGFISVESLLTVGTTFRLYFPTPDSKVLPEEPVEAVPFHDGGTETILVVEDEVSLLDMLRFMLEAKGYTILAAHDGAEAVAIYTQHRAKIAMVITDLGLPVMTGLEEYKALKGIDPDVRVVFASGFIEPEVRAELISYGAEYFLQKPYDTDEVLKTIRNVLM